MIENLFLKEVKKNIYIYIILDCIGISVNFVALPADPRYNPGDGYENANVHLKSRMETDQRFFSPSQKNKLHDTKNLSNK